MQTVVCMKWGSRYGADYVNRLNSMVLRNTKRPTQLICFTDDGSGVDASVKVHPLPPIRIPARVANRPWRKISLWQPQLAGLTGDALFMDLDLVVTGPLDGFFDHAPGKFAVIHNWTQPDLRIGNTSVYRFGVGSQSHIFETFERDGERVISEFPNSQTWISSVAKDMEFWPADWCVSFKASLLPRWPMNFFQVPSLPPTARVVAFPGKPDPDEAVVGRWPVTAAWKRIYKHVRPVPWIAEHWR
jgi:hypothetical protein